MGVDGSAAMLVKAAAAGFETAQAEISTWAPAAPVDVIFSNAALQWLGGHEALFPHLLECLAPGGVLAVQMPSMHAAPLRAEQDRIAREGPWAEALQRVKSAPPILSPEAYYALLSPRVAKLEMWVTEYIHVMRPFLDALGPESRKGFLAEYAAAMRAAYPPGPDGAVLLPFRRLFMLVRK
jgi:trans-aconitate 2-methyltransferase